VKRKKRGMDKRIRFPPLQREEAESSCPVFGVESGGPVIGLGLLLILFGIFPLLPGAYRILPLPLTLLFIGFGTFLVILGTRK